MPYTVRKSVETMSDVSICYISITHRLSVTKFKITIILILGALNNIFHIVRKSSADHKPNDHVLRNMDGAA